MVWRRSANWEVARDGVGTIGAKEGDTGERIVHKVMIIAHLRPDTNQVEIGERGGATMIADKETSKNRAGMVELDDNTHGGEVDLLLAHQVEAADVADRSQDQHSKLLLLVLEGEPHGGRRWSSRR